MPGPLAGPLGHFPRGSHGTVRMMLVPLHRALERRQWPSCSRRSRASLRLGSSSALSPRGGLEGVAERLQLCELVELANGHHAPFIIGLVDHSPSSLSRALKGLCTSVSTTMSSWKT